MFTVRWGHLTDFSFHPLRLSSSIPISFIQVLHPKPQILFSRSAILTPKSAIRSFLLPCLFLLFSGAALAAPISITSIEDLQKIGNDPAYPLDGGYILTQDVDAAETAGWNGGAGFNPIGKDTLPFTGTFNGQAHIIYNLMIDLRGKIDVGLFSYVSSEGRVENLGLVNGSIVGSSDVGGLVGENNGSIERCFTSCTVFGSFRAGGLIGMNSGNVEQCYATSAVSGHSDLGGLMGWNGGNVQQCYATGAVTGNISACYVGGLIAQNTGTVMQCFATGRTYGGDTLGGLVGTNYASGSVTQCYARGAVLGSIHLGGLVAYAENDQVYASFWDTQTSEQALSDGGIGITTDQMLQSTTFTEAEWDYSQVWTQTDGETIPYFLFSSAPA
nr:hypothetical protein [Candidatus Hydrogenedentota bacterium]